MVTIQAAAERGWQGIDPAKVNSTATKPSSHDGPESLSAGAAPRQGTAGDRHLSGRRPKR